MYLIIVIILLFLQKKKNMKQERKVVHVELFNGESDENAHRYYGSIACIYDDLTPADVGITYSYLRNMKISQENPYHNKKCIIRIGVLKTKTTNRGIRKNETNK